jgi:hypothetical protein
MGKQIYLTDNQVQLLLQVLGPGNFSCETGDDEYDEKMLSTRDRIFEKLMK